MEVYFSVLLFLSEVTRSKQTSQHSDYFSLSIMTFNMTCARYLTMLALWWEEDKLWFTATAASLIGANLARNVSLNNDYITVTRLDSTTPIVSNPFLFLHLWFNYLKHHLIYSTLSNKYASHALETIRSQWIWHLGDEKYYHRRRTCWRRPDQVWFPCINDSWYCM